MNKRIPLSNTQKLMAALLSSTLLLASCNFTEPHQAATAPSSESRQEETTSLDETSSETASLTSTKAETSNTGTSESSSSETSQTDETSAGSETAETTAATASATTAAVTTAAQTTTPAETAAPVATTTAVKQTSAATTEAPAAASTAAPAGTTALTEPTESAAPAETTAVPTGSTPAATTEAPEDDNGLSLSPGHNVSPDFKCVDAAAVRDIIRGKAANTLGGKYIFLTFDDGINSKSTPRILDVLAKEHVPGTFFVVGYTLTDRTGPILQRIAKEGHAIGIHSFDHDYDHLYPGRYADPKEITRQAQVTLDRIHNYLGSGFETHLWRYPGGHMSWKNMQPADEALAGMGLTWIDWNGMAGLADIRSRRPKDVPGVLKYMINSTKWSPTKEVYVMLLHDTGNKLLIPEALPTIIKHYRDLGYNFGVLK